MKEGIIAGLDIGTTKICAIIGEVEYNGDLKILGVGKAPSLGLKRGVVVNLEKTVSSIASAVEEAELMAGININGALIGIGGDHIRSMNSQGVIAVSRSGSNRVIRHNEITQDDVGRVMEAATAVSLGLDREILHIIPQEYSVDDQFGIKDPVGITGIKLESMVHIITCAATSSKNIINAVNLSHITPKKLVLEPLASSHAVLQDEEKELGTALIDFGGGTSDIAIYFDGTVRHTAVVGLGGENITNDVAYMLRTPRDQAEEIKCRYGCAKQSLVEKDEFFKMKSIGGRPPREISRELLASYIEPRAEEILRMIRQEMKKCDRYELLAGGVVLTGGGAMLNGIVDLAEEILEMPVKIGVPHPPLGLIEMVGDPSYATAVGLLYHAMGPESLIENLDTTEGTVFKKVMNKMFQAVTDFFV